MPHLLRRVPGPPQGASDRPRLQFAVPSQSGYSVSDAGNHVRAADGSNRQVDRRCRAIRFHVVTLTGGRAWHPPLQRSPWLGGSAERRLAARPGIGREENSHAPMWAWLPCFYLCLSSAQASQPIANLALFEDATGSARADESVQKILT
jgi:hypothetical protein